MNYIRNDYKSYEDCAARHDNIYAIKNSLKKNYYYSEDEAWEIVRMYHLVDNVVEQEVTKEDVKSDEYLLVNMKGKFVTLPKHEFEFFMKIYQELEFDKFLLVTYKKI